MKNAILSERSSGILLHPTSLPGPYGIGDLGGEARAFVDFLHAAGQQLWQVLPLGPTGYGNSPYQSGSAFAGNPLLISPEDLVADGLLVDADLESRPSPAGSVQAGTVTHKLALNGTDKLELYDWPGGYAQRFDGIAPGGGDRGDISKVFEDNARTVGIRLQQEAVDAVMAAAQPAVGMGAPDGA